MSRYNSVATKVDPVARKLTDTKSPYILDSDKTKPHNYNRLTKERLEILVLGNGDLTQEEVHDFKTALRSYRKPCESRDN
ncbi:hypothetical protein AYI68_g3783 [Smittium mucronatum]|uniref:Uncharacterized protein n=1 Tax=Smittium mucronatum TaxID=133383 RepID=A0A1R0GYW1_9FUNG|nr:hypothetical protein AYI68_g3783 [Smittium mucronatum]